MSTDILIVGNGVLGLSLAAVLASRDSDLEVTVVGPDSMQAAASSAAGAMLNCFGEVTKYTRSSSAERAKFEVLRSAASMWPEWIEQLRFYASGSMKLERHEGTTVIQNARGGHLDVENFDAFLQAIEEYDEPFEEIDAHDIPGMDPLPDARPLRSIYLPREGWLDGSALMSSLRSACSNLGVQLVDATITRLTQVGDRVTGGTTDADESITAGTTVIAAGARTTQLLESVGGCAIQPVVSGCGIAVTLKRVTGTPFSGVIRTVNRAGSCGLHVVPLDNIEYVGATNVIFRDPEPDTWPAVCHFLLQCAMEQLDQSMSIARVEEWRVGNRPVTLDTFPLIGSAFIDGLYLLTGTYRDGLHSSPALAEAVANDLLNSEPALGGVFNPERAPISTMTVEESIDEFVLQNLSSAFESTLTIPRFWNHRDLERMFRPLAEEVYEQLGIDWGLAPDIVGFLALSRKSRADVADIAARVRRCSASPTAAAADTEGAAR